jgi:hypothetical protein
MRADRRNLEMPTPKGKEERRRLEVAALETWLWDAACQSRGPLDAPKYKDHILPLVFLKRPSDVFDDEVAHLAQEFGDRKTAARLIDQDHKLVRFFIPEKARWSFVAGQTTGLGELLTDAVRAVARENPRLSGVIDGTAFNAMAAGQRIVADGRLAALVQVLNNPAYRLGMDDVGPDILGRAYEYLLRKFAQGQGQSAGEWRGVVRRTGGDAVLVVADVVPVEAEPARVADGVRGGRRRGTGRRGAFPAVEPQRGAAPVLVVGRRGRGRRHVVGRPPVIRSCQMVKS